jgi:hypothetical protein
MTMMKTKHVRKPPYRVKGTRQLIRFEKPLVGSAVKALVDDEFWDASQRRVHWDVYEMEKTTSSGKAAPRVLRKNLLYSDTTQIPITEKRLENGMDFEDFLGQVEDLDDGSTVADALTLELFSGTRSSTLEPLICSFCVLRDNQSILPEGLLEMLILPEPAPQPTPELQPTPDPTSEPTVTSLGDGAFELGTIWVPHPDHGLVRRSARLASRRIRELGTGILE